MSTKFQISLDNIRPEETKELTLLKQSINGIDAENIIAEALEIGKNLEKNKSTKRTNGYKESAIDTVNDTINVSRQTFVSNLLNRKTKEVKEYFKVQVDICNSKAEKILAKNKIHLLKCRDEIDNYKTRNINLEDEIKAINTNCQKIDLQIKEQNEMISQLQTKFTLFENVKPLLEELIREFPEEDPVSIINEIRNSKDKNITMIYQLNSTKMKIDNLQKETTDEQNKALKNKVDLERKIKEENYDAKLKLAKVKKELLELQNEVALYKTYQRNNNKLIYLLYNLYQNILSKIQKDKIIESEKRNKISFVFTKDNFNPEIFDNKIFIDLIHDTILKNTSSNKDCIRLRQTIAFANMMVRRFLSKKENLRFDLVNTFKELKALIDKQEFENHKLKCVIQSLKTNEQKNKQTIKELNNELKLSKLKYSSLMNKVDRQFKIENNSDSKSRLSTEIIRINSARPLLKQRAKTPINQSKYNKRKFFITTTNSKYGKKRTTQSASSKHTNKDKLLKIPTVNESFSQITESKLSYLSGESDNSELDSKHLKKMEALRKNFKKFKDIKVSKNKDKLIKSNGFKGIESFIVGIKSIVENSNRAYYYQAKVESSMPKTQIKAPPSTQGIKTETQIETACETQNKVEKTKYDLLSKRIMTNINNMIEDINMVTEKPADKVTKTD